MFLSRILIFLGRGAKATIRRSLWATAIDFIEGFVVNLFVFKLLRCAIDWLLNGDLCVSVFVPIPGQRVFRYRE